MLLAVREGRGLGEDAVRVADVTVLGTDDGELGTAGAPGLGVSGLAGRLYRK
ncbi:hypothetical protein ACFZB2_39735 [Streptomyces bobili]|uniref:hypothetical protein n=1 Tax=Streptomyces bobili TaxID=67280 RepID=UPI0036E7E5DE